MKKISWIVLLVALFLGSGTDRVQAALIERAIFAGDTPLLSTCTVTQSGPMELTVAPCSFITTGQSRIVEKSKVKNLPNEIAAGRVEMMSDGKRVRGWLRDKAGNIIEKARALFLPVSAVTIIPTGNTYFLYLVEKAGPTLGVVLLSESDPRPVNYVHFLAFAFTVPAGTTDLSGITIEVFTVKPGFPPARGIFER